MMSVRFYNLIGIKHIQKDLLFLIVHRIFLRIGLVGIGSFVVVRLYQYFDKSLMYVAFVFSILHILVLFSTPFFARFLRKYGLKIMMIMATPFSAISLFALSFIDTHPLVSISVYIITLAIYKAMYWVPYNVDFGRLLDNRTRGRQVSFLQNVSDTLIAFMPLLIGILIETFGFNFSFIFGAVIMMIGILPLFFISNMYESYSWDFLESFKKLFQKENRRILFAYMGDGAQGIALMVAWTLFVFTIVKEKLILFGGITAVTLFVLLILRSFTGNLFDKWSKRKILIIGAIISSTGWFIKLFVISPVHVFFSDTYHGMGRVIKRTSVGAMMFEQAADNGRYIDEYTTLREMSMAIGRISMLLFLSGAFYLFGFDVAVTLAIIISALITLSVILLSKNVKRLY